ncbi:glycerophosphodiester phosphodiesterase [Halalkalibacter krulwichiae]|nr:glycerophosphodiester phosphodiesterase [Halalkalibacter krulwichiae]
MIKIYAHRGYSDKYPENTMVAFQAAVDYGADGIEFDVQLTKDNVPVVIHDLTVDRTTTGSGRVRDLTVRELKEFSAGAWFGERFDSQKISTLEEVLAWAMGNSIMLNIELKGVVTDREEMIAAILSILKKFDCEDRLILSSFDHPTIQSLTEEAPLIEMAIIVASALFKPEEYLRRLKIRGYHFSHISLREEEIRGMIYNGFRLRPYTVNEDQLIKQFINSGCDALFTDKVERAVKIRNRWIKNRSFVRRKD